MNNGKELRALSLFTGAMGLDLGIEKSGFNVLACIENDKMCVETIKLNRPNIKVYPDDINKIDPEKVLNDLKIKPGEIDLIVGGPPCQAFSTAGKRRSFDDFRGNVIVRFLDYVKVIKPKYFILENVRGIYYAKLENTPPEFSEYKSIEDMPGGVVYFLYREFTRLGYNVSFNLFDSSFYSVPQKRERFIMFGSSSGMPIPIPKPTSIDNPLTLRDAIGDIQVSDGDFIKIRGKSEKFLSLLKHGQYWKDLPLGLQKEAMGKSYYLSGGKTGFYRRLSWDRPSPTLVTHPTMPATMLAHPSKMRPLSVQEYAKIQQFPNNWKFSGKLIDIYKQIGNAVPVGLGYMAGKAIIDHINGVVHPSYKGQTSRYKLMSNEEFISVFEERRFKQSTNDSPTFLRMFENGFTG